MNNQARYEELSQRLQSNEEFKQRFIDSPKEILADFGIKIPDSVAVRVHEDTVRVKNLVIPVRSGVENENTASNPLFRKAIALAFADENYKAQLLQNPKAALSELTEESLPADLEIRVHENSSTLRHLVIFVDSVGEELSEVELEAVAGGLIHPFLMGFFLA
jgi:ABC-type oligopeptide transport system substrate-binding subunit